MVAQTQAREIRLRINGVNYDEYLIDFSIGFESWQQGKGILKKSGELKIGSIRNGRAIDPRDNQDFAPGNEVTIQVRRWITFGEFIPHPLAGKLLILSPPTIEPIVSSAPVVEGNLILSIPVGCALNYYTSNQPDDDKSEVILGVSKPVAEIIQNILLAGNVPPANIGGTIAGGSVFTSPFTINFPLPKQSSGFVDLAGELTYCTAAPGYLYCDNENNIQIKELDLDAGSTITVTLGVNDREYVPQLDGSLPPLKVRAVGIKKQAIRDSECQTSRFEIPDILKQSSEICKYEYGGHNIIVNLPPAENELLGGKSIYMTGYRVVRSESETQGFIESAWRLTTRVINYKVFFELNLLYEYIQEFNVRGVVAPDLTDQTPLNSGYDYILEKSRVEFTEYNYDNLGNVKELLINEWQCKVAISKDSFTDPYDAQAFTLAHSRDYRGRWKAKGGNWTEEVVERKSRALVEQGFTESDRSSATPYDLVPTVESRTAISDTGQTVPPKPETWNGLESEQEEQLEGIAEFTNGKGELTITVPYAFTVQQLEKLAQFEGEIVWGRAYQYLIECDPTLMQYQQSPVPIVRVHGAGENRVFMADSIQWYHQKNQDYVGFAGVYLGGSSGNPSTIGGGDRVSTSGPVIVSIGGGSSGGGAGTGTPTTPSGTPRPPLPLDEVLAVAYDGILIEDTIALRLEEN